MTKSDWISLKQHHAGRLSVEDMTIVDMLIEGKSTAEIGRALGQHRSMIWRKTERIKIVSLRSTPEEKSMADTKVVFVAFAIEDARMRDLLKGQSLHTNSPFEYVDMSVKDPYDDEWKKRVRTRILRSDGVIALVSKNSLTSTGQKWEIQCAKEEKKPLRGIWAYTDDRTNLVGVNTVVWTWPNVAAFIDSL
jgi:DNA-binding CsgD family transcriptional regulator